MFRNFMRCILTCDKVCIVIFNMYFSGIYFWKEDRKTFEELCEMLAD